MSNPLPPPDEYGPYGPPPITITFTAVLVVFFIVGLCSLCFCKCYTRQNQNDHSTTNPSDQSSDKPRQGLELSTIMAFPTLVYSNVKSLRMEDFDLECAICLSEFEDDSVLRLLTVCYHVFHQECIDLWLESHMSCPVCRANLDLPVEKILEKFPDMLRDKNMPDIHEESESVFEDAVSIDIGSDDVKEDKIWRGRRPEAASNAMEHNERHPRWHSTGHSVVTKQAEGGSGCRYTLRLPENVRVKVSRGHGGRSVTFGGVSDHNQVAFGEVVGSSSRGSSS